MKIICILVILALSFFMAYLRYAYTMKCVKESRFLCDFSDRLYANISEKMSKVNEVYNTAYEETFGEKTDCRTTSDVVDSIRKKFPEAENSDKIIFYIDKYSHSSAWEMRDICENLRSEAFNGLKISENRLTKYGKTAFIIYPGVTAMLILTVL